MSSSLMKHLTDALSLDEGALSNIGITIYTPEGKIKDITTILKEIAEFWSEDLEEKIKNDSIR